MAEMKVLILAIIIGAAVAAPARFRVGGSSGGRIIGGVPAPQGAWPWQASLLTPFRGHTCGGVVIAPDVILTAAHCLQGGYVDVLLGTNTNIPGMGGEMYPTVAAIMHQSYTPTRGHANDIGLVLLAYPYNPSNSRIRAANLPSSPNANYRSGCYISGWGMTESGSPSSTLLQAQINIFDQNMCNQAMQGAIGPYHICVSANGMQGACFGDSGGPLSCPGQRGWEVAGVTSWGVQDCNPAKPSIYTRVSYYLDWIGGKMIEMDQYRK